MDQFIAHCRKNKNGGLVRKQRKEDGYMIEQIVAYNKKFVEEKGYEPYLTSKYPDKKLAILTCMDTRLIELLPAALGTAVFWGFVEKKRGAGAENAPQGVVKSEEPSLQQEYSSEFLKRQKS